MIYTEPDNKKIKSILKELRKELKKQLGTECKGKSRLCGSCITFNSLAQLEEFFDL